jgi:hypothetical protein
MKYLFIFLSILFISQAFADPEAKSFVKVGFDESQEYWVGQKVSFTVELYSPGWFTGSPRFEIPEVDGVIIYKVKGSPVLGTVDQEGHSYSRQSHSFTAFTRRPGKVHIPSFKIEFQVVTPGSKGLLVSHKSQAIEIRSQLPPQSKKKNFITTEEYSLKEDWSKNTEELELKVGDALVRTIRQTASNSLSMLIPELQQQKIAGISFYKAPATRVDNVERGEFRCSVSEKLTYVFEKGGEFNFPEVTIYSWSPSNESFAQHTLPAVRVSVIANPLYKKEIDVETMALDRENSDSYLAWLLVIIVIFLGVFRKYLMKEWALWQDRRMNSEFYAFKQVLKMAKRRDLHGLYLKLNSWLSKVDNVNQRRSLNHFVDEFGDSNLIDSVNCLNKCLFAKEDMLFNYGQFVDSLKKSRLKFKVTKKKKLIKNRTIFSNLN